MNARDDLGNTPLHSVYSEKVVQALLKSGADINAQNEQGDTPLHTHQKEEALKVLIDGGADPHIRNHKGEAPISSGTPFFNDLRAQERAKLLDSVLPPASAWKPPEGGFAAQAQRELQSALKSANEQAGGQPVEAPRQRVRF